MFDYHIHSDFSADCSEPMYKTIEKAISLGLKEICFTDHIDYDYPDTTITFDLDLNNYDKKIREMQTKYKEEIIIKKGVEIGIQPHLLKRYESVLNAEDFDFIICSMHTTNNKDLHSGSLFDGITVEKAFELYYSELYNCIKDFDMYSILGHIDLIKRYTKRKVENDFHELIEAIFKEIIPKGKGIEINTSGYRYGLESGMPSIDILKLYKDVGGEIITLGSDSHIEETLCYKFDKSIDLLENLGFKYIATFKEQVPEFHPIQSLR